jgi:Arc/MetJ family transcription regulator
MRTNIEIDDELMRQAMLLSGKRTKNEVVEAGLRLLIEAYPKLEFVASKARFVGKAISAALAAARLQD